MRILFTGDADHVHLRRWVVEMARRGAECHVLTRRPGVVAGAAAVHVVRPGSDGAGWLLALPQVRALARRLAPDLVHGHYVTSNGLWAAACGVKPVVLTAWGSDLLVTPRSSRAMRALTGWTLRRADLITGDAQDLIDEAQGYGLRAPCELVSWGADTDFFRPPTEPRPRAEFRLLSLRSWEPNYRIDLILQALALLRARGVPAVLTLLGGGSLEKALRAQAQALGMAPHVDFAGRQDDAGMRRWMQASHVSVMVPASDATSVSLLESLACGLAVVVSDLPANRAWVDHRGGRLVPGGDAGALADALQALWSDPAALAAMGTHNRALAVLKASRKDQMDRMFALYGRLLGRPGAVAEGAA